MWIVRSASLLLGSNTAVGCVRYLSNKYAVFTKIRRKLYLKFYPTVIVNPDGSTYTVRHFEPRKIIKLPLDLSTVSEEERAIILMKRKPVKQVKIIEEVDDSFDNRKYLKILKRKAN